jgi:hypothetical protein
VILLSTLYCFTEAGQHFVRIKEEAALEAEARGMFSYMEEEIRRCDHFEKRGNRLVFKHWSGLDITYEQIGNRVVRRANTEGYIIVAAGVSIFQFEVKREGCLLYVEMNKGTAKWKGTLFIGKRVELAEAK